MLKYSLGNLKSTNHHLDNLQPITQQRQMAATTTTTHQLPIALTTTTTTTHQNKIE
jgi:hypothetical protein